MEDKLATAEKKVLVELVKHAQKRGMQGSQGGWKDFLKIYDKKLGSSVSDPARKSNDALLSFLKTFTEENDQQFFAKVLQWHLNRDVLVQFRKESPENETPEQRLVRITLEHVQYPFDYMFPSHEAEWVVTKLGKKSKVMRSSLMLALDCEMVLCEDGTEAVVKVCVVDRYQQEKLNKLVNPNKAVADYRTEITGITAEDLDGVSCSLADIQKSLKKLLSHGIILVGHSLNNDLKALKLDHARVVDTSYIFKYSDGPIFKRPSLHNLCKSVLGYELRKEGAPHNCLDDARAAMKLALARIEHGVDNISFAEEDVMETEMAKLLLHRIPINVPTEELKKVLPGAFTVEVKASKKAQAEKYCAFAIFKSSFDALQAFENVKGIQNTDSYGRPQKLITFHLKTGQGASLYVRKMVPDDSLGSVSTGKRAVQGEDFNESKRLKIDQKPEEDIRANSNQSEKYLKEIEILKQELRDKELNQCVDHLKEIEILKQQLRDRELNQCDDHLKEIELRKKELRDKEFHIDMQDKMILKLKNELKAMKERRK
ncbi:hypothetical protein HS088_TW01G00792 [Tripterygium wilfordii]|uniref:Exonuclease domain-containing protein n=1 Tax=Tripterygium wilfordii TaxID=458696 RepID=A0A7J7E340_TRIWF|nr:small RNA degrading nuclease 1 [Tripterygium wilfordii]KAF5752874.1 hypothetical protein HS088_TW01G00792 [Tripterygium wilfordii]